MGEHKFNCQISQNSVTVAFNGLLKWQSRPNVALMATLNA